MSSDARHNAAGLWSAVAVADWHLVFFGAVGRTCNVTPAVSGLQAALPTAEGAGVLRHVQGIWLL